MERRLLILAITLTACACGLPMSERPIGVEDQLGALRGAGLECQDPEPDNVPSGLLQWTCQGEVDDTTVVVVMDGDERGVFEVSAGIDNSAGRLAQIRAWNQWLRMTGLTGSHETEILSWLETWDGGDIATRAGAVTAEIINLSSQTILRVSPGPRRQVDDAIPP